MPLAPVPLLASREVPDAQRAAAIRNSSRSPSSRIQVLWGYLTSRAPIAVRTTSSRGSLYVVMNTSTVRPGRAMGGAGRSRAFHIINAKRMDSESEYVSAITNGIAIHQADQAIVSLHRQKI